MSMTKAAQVKAMNQAFFEKLDSKDPAIVKQAAQDVNDYIRTRMREDGIFRTIIEPVPIGNDELDPQVDTDANVKVIELEPDSPGAVGIPYGTLPQRQVIFGRRARVMFARLATPEFTKDVGLLRTYVQDIRQIISDNALKDLLAQEDGQAIRTCNSLLVGADQVVPATGTVQWRTIDGGITRETWNDAMKVMEQTPNHLTAAKCLVNTIFLKDLQKWGGDELGQNLSEEVAKTGFVQRQFFGKDLIATIKRNLVRDSSVMMFAPEQNLGKFYVLEDATMYIDKDKWFVTMCAAEEIGSLIANVAGVARVDFTGDVSSNVWRY